EVAAKRGDKGHVDARTARAAGDPRRDVLSLRLHPAAEMGRAEAELEVDDAVLPRVLRRLEGDTLDPFTRGIEPAIELELGKEVQESRLLAPHRRAPAQLARGQVDPDFTRQLRERPE